MPGSGRGIRSMSADMTIRFVVEGEPRGKGRARITRHGAYTPETTVMYENLIKIEYQRQCQGKRFGDNQALAMEVVAVYAIPASASKTKRAAMLRGELRPTKKPDWDNIGKIVSDALNQIAYRDDSQIVDCRVQKIYGENPKMTVCIWSRE